MNPSKPFGLIPLRVVMVKPGKFRRSEQRPAGDADEVGSDPFVNEPFVVTKGGIYKVPTGPGLGVTLDEKAVDKYRVA
jgi:hypothetical protein